MDNLGIPLIIIGCCGSALWWLFALRPYLRRHHDGYNTGANLFVAAWVDWQRCGELAKQKNDPNGRWRYWGFVILQVCFLIGVIIKFTIAG